MEFQRFYGHDLDHDLDFLESRDVIDDRLLDYWIRNIVTFCEKNQNGVHHLELLFGNSGPSTKSTFGPKVARQISF